MAVYGTLRRGGPANGFLLGAKYLGQDKIKGTIYNLGAFPGLVLDDGGEVIVDLYELPADDNGSMLQEVDIYEGYYPTDKSRCLYHRRNVTTLEGCLEVMAYEYAHEVDNKWVVKSGDWFNPS
ncbi:gamma-glutamylcyclotransferase family protein [Thalassospira sp.]|uniref:gamma-glutamylcyclotransferase family protein n=1 Tax=Thalassospira sp. TaxID=1912094 RepID=UPI0025E48EB7|nr:gamma-glutamylcyclotransferase family protein [Thalassospira sp.]